MVNKPPIGRRPGSDRLDEIESLGEQFHHNDHMNLISNHSFFGDRREFHMKPHGCRLIAMHDFALTPLIRPSTLQGSELDHRGSGVIPNLN